MLPPDLVDTFLLPSLVLALSYMANQLWSDITQEKKAITRVLQLVLLTKQGSNEAQAMLAAVLNIVAKPLEHALRVSQRQNPKSQEIEPLLRALQEHTRFSRRTAGAGHNELEAWTSTQGGGIAAAVRHTVQGFVQWALQPALNVMPTAYTHRQLLAAQRILGGPRLLRVVLDELRQQTEAGNAAVAYDVATAIVCAPDVTNAPPPPESLDPHSSQQQPPSAQDGMLPPPPPPPPQSRISLRQALRFEAEDFKAVQRRAGGDPAAAEAVVRLHRRVEAQLLAPPPPPHHHHHPDEVSAAAAAEALGLAGGVGVDDDAAATAAAEAELNSALEAAAAASASNGGGGGGGAGGLGGPGAGGLDDDIFGGLDGWDLMQ